MSLSFFSSKNPPKNVPNIRAVYCTYSLLYLVSCPRISCQWSLQDSWKKSIKRSLISGHAAEFKISTRDQVQSHVIFNSFTLRGDGRKWWVGIYHCIETHGLWRQFKFDKIKNWSWVIGKFSIEEKEGVWGREKDEKFIKSPRKWKLFTERFSNAEARKKLIKEEKLFMLINYL